MRRYTPEERIEAFWNKVDKPGGEDACWLWAGSLDSWGYGNFRWSASLKKAHRVSYELSYGVIPKRKLVLHTCDTPACVNPRHLWLGTNQDNMDDMYRKGRGNKPQGEDNGNNKLTTTQVNEIRSRYATGGVRYIDLAQEYGVAECTIGRIIRRENWTGINPVQQLPLLTSGEEGAA